MNFYRVNSRFGYLQGSFSSAVEAQEYFNSLQSNCPYVEMYDSVTDTWRI